MDPSQYILLFCLLAFIVIGINAFLYVTLTRKNTVGQVDLLRKAAARARDPWGDENANLKELSERISDLRERGLLAENTSEDLEALAGVLKSGDVAASDDLKAMVEALVSEDIQTSQDLRALADELPPQERQTSEGLEALADALSAPDEQALEDEYPSKNDAGASKQGG